MNRQRCREIVVCCAIPRTTLNCAANWPSCTSKQNQTAEAQLLLQETLEIAPDNQRVKSLLPKKMPRMRILQPALSNDSDRTMSVPARYRQPFHVSLCSVWFCSWVRNQEPLAPNSQQSHIAGATARFPQHRTRPGPLAQTSRSATWTSLRSAIFETGASAA